METEKSQRPIKIIKKHLKTNDFDSDVYILNYQISIFGIKIWREFPIYFCREDILKDFIETAYIFNFKFSSIFSCSLNFDDFRYGIETKNFTIYFKSTLTVMGKYVVFYKYSDFVIKENKNEEYAPKYESIYLSVAYGSYNSEIYKNGLSESLEEKTYKLALEEN
jgi:hypothetical protein